MALFTRRKHDGPQWGGNDTPARISAAVNRDYTDAVLPVDPEGALYGPVAQGLSLSAPMGVASDLKWNSLTDTGRWAPSDIGNSLSDRWGIDDPEHWFEVLDMLLAGQYGDSVAYHAANVRTAAKRRRDVPVLDDATWAHELAAEAARVGAPDGYGDAMIESIVAIRRAEHTLRTARLIAADEEVEALSGYDLLRAGNVARWGVAAGLGGPHVVSNVALHARDAVLVNHSSWRSYALSLTAGRLVTYPDTWGAEVVDVIEWIRPMLDSRHSPWNHLPFPDAPVLGEQ